MRCTTLAAALVLLPVLSGCTEAAEPRAAQAPDLCSGDEPSGTCLDRVQLELSQALATAAGGGPADEGHLEQAFTEVLRQERIGASHSFTRVSEVQEWDAQGPPRTPVQFRLGVGDVQRTYWACLPTVVMVVDDRCPPAPVPAS